MNSTLLRICAGALIPKHAHFLLFSGTSRLPALMQRLLTGYAVCFNRRHKRSGHRSLFNYGAVREFATPLTDLVRRFGMTTFAVGDADVTGEGVAYKKGSNRLIPIELLKDVPPFRINSRMYPHTQSLS